MYMNLHKTFEKITFLFIFIFLLTACEESHHKIETSLVPRSILLSNPNRFCVSMNHTGDKISYLARKGNEIELCVEDLSGNIIKKFDVKDCAGTYNHQWGFTGDHILIGQDNNGDENDHVICLNIKTGASKDLTPFKARSHIGGLSRKHPHEILVLSNKRDPKWFDIYRINIITGKTDLVLKNNEYISFYFDNDFKFRIASKMMPDGSIEDYLIDNGKKEFFRKVCFEDTKNTSFMYFNANNKVVYGTDSIGRDKSAFVAYDLQNKTSKILFESNLADVQLFSYDPNTLTPQCICVNYLKPEIFVMDKSISKDIAYLKSHSHSKNFDIIRNLKDDTWLTIYHSSNSCKKYYLYKRDPQKCEPISLKFLFSAKPSIDKYKLQEKTPIEIKSRDGLNLVCYLTKSFDFYDANPRKLILYIHGGPWGRDGGDYCDPDIQLFANRGYSVLQVNYRGSTGFGKKFTNAANGNLHKVRNDIIDCVNWAIANQIADKNHIAIMGASFGGYSALAGLVFTPDVFCCGVDVVGISNFITFLKTMPDIWQPEIETCYKLFGDPRTKEGQKLLIENSPITYAHNIKKPLLIFQGKNDPRVNQNEADQIVSELKKNKLQVAYIMYPDEGHGFQKEPNYKSYIAMTELFLAKIMGGRHEPIHKEELEKSSHQILEGKDVIGLE